MSATTKHTVGNWEFLEAGCTEDEGNRGRPLTICGGTNEDLANVYSCDDSTVTISRDEAIANARLIAAAPDLLAACIRARDAIITNPGTNINTRAYEALTTTIALATGDAR